MGSGRTSIPRAEQVRVTDKKLVPAEANRKVVARADSHRLGA